MDEQDDDDLSESHPGSSQIPIDIDQQEDFIVQDSEGEAEFDARLLPAEFRMSSYQNLEHHFKVLSQYYIHLAVTGPSFASSSTHHYFKSALEAFRRRFAGTLDSLVTSSVWKPDFKHSLETYPDFIVGVLDEAVPGCDACHLSGRMSKYEGRLEGEAYDPETFEVGECLRLCVFT